MTEKLGNWPDDTALKVDTNAIRMAWMPGDAKMQSCKYYTYSLIVT
jgi:hypothetical protein